MAGCLLATCVGGLLISQNRNMLIGLLFGVVAASVLSVRSSRAIMATFVAASVVVAIVGLAPMIGAAPTSTEGRLAMRVTSVANLQAVNATSLSDRTYENRLAWRALKTSPVFGIGWGTSYGATYQGTTRNWIHNGYLWLWLRLGIVPAVAFIVALLAAVRIGVLWQRHGESETSWLGSGIIAALLAMMVSALVGSYFSEPEFDRLPHGPARLCGVAGASPPPPPARCTSARHRTAVGTATSHDPRASDRRTQGVEPAQTQGDRPSDHYRAHPRP